MRVYSLKYLIAISLFYLLSGMVGCDQDPLTITSEELAEQIRRNTPTELPPITTKGENTMGAWIHPQPGSPLHDLEGDSLLFVASGVDRPETALATSLDCDAFDNLLFQSNNYLSVDGNYCRRPEIGDDRDMSLIFGFIEPDSIQVFFNIQPSKIESNKSYWKIPLAISSINYTILKDDRNNSVFSGQFSGRIVNRSPPFDTLRITQGRFDVTYGTTP